MLPTLLDDVAGDQRCGDTDGADHTRCGANLTSCSTQCHCHQEGEQQIR